MASSSKIRVGIIGYGLSAKVFQIPFLAASPAYELRAIVQRSGGSAQQDHPSCTVYRLADDLFADTDVDLVVVSTPPPTHFDLTSQALKAGKHVVVEKPFAPTSAECEALIAQAKESKRILSVFQNRRWDADFLTLQKIISEGSLGRLVEFESHFDRDAMPTVAKPAQPGAGVIYDLGVHLIDQALVLFGLPRKISGFLMSQAPVNENGVADACTVLLHYDRGLLVTIKASAVSVDTEQLRFWVRGEQGSYLKCHIDPQEPQIAAGMKTSDPKFGREDSGNDGSLTTREDGKLQKVPLPNVTPATYTKFYDLLAAVIQGKGMVPVTAETARDAIKLVELSIKSSAEGRTLAVE